MKSIGKRFAVATAGLVSLALCGSVLANGSRELEIRDDIVFQGRPVAAGSYTLEWKEKDGGLVDVTLRNGKKVLATAPAAHEALDRPSDLDGIVFRTGADGSREISRILISGATDAIRIEPGARAGLK